ncbi:MAG: MOSC domain-containing protein [Gemmataceae bacterium]
MFEGKLLGIYVAAAKTADLVAVEQVEASLGRGLEGDRYCVGAGTFSKPDQVDREVTLIEMEALEALAREENIELSPGKARRNLVTRGVPLNHLVGREFTVGEVKLRGIRLCEPCKHLEKLTQTGVMKGLMHRGGLRAQIVSPGTLHTNDPVRPA